ncbi:MAG: YbaK/EbsC family protein [Acidobacteria bacterium]|nr:MAG: YbaK/EbsC family protein [Acidobacteriota bacterium]
MPVSPTVQEFLRRADVAYTVLPHARAYTARQEAATMSVPPGDWAKVVVAFADGEPIQAVVPADCDVDFAQLARVIGVPDVRMATEDELDWLYPDCEAGAMPPLGPLFHQLVFIDERLADSPEIVFNAGTFDDAVAMSFVDFARLAHPTIGRFARPAQRVV